MNEVPQTATEGIDTTDLEKVRMEFWSQAYLTILERVISPVGGGFPLRRNGEVINSARQMAELADGALAQFDARFVGGAV